MKAAREGKEETSWHNPNEAYEKGLNAFIEGILDPGRSPEFLQSLGTMAKRLALLGALNSLTQLTLKATMPGVPDFYQGTEFWDLSMVDPDNRRPVDFAARESALRQCESPDWTQLAEHWPDGRIKLAWTRHLLKLRNAQASVFTDGAYQPLEVTGRDADHIIAFARRLARGRYRRDRAALCCVHRQRPGLASRRSIRCDGARHRLPPSIQGRGCQRNDRLPAAIIPARSEAAAEQFGKRQPAAAAAPN